MSIENRNLGEFHVRQSSSLKDDINLEVTRLWHTRRTLKDILRERLNLSGNVDPEDHLAKEVVAWITQRPRVTYYIKKISVGSYFLAFVTACFLGSIFAGFWWEGVDPKLLPGFQKDIIVKILLASALLYFVGMRISSQFRKTEQHDEDILRAMKTKQGKQQMGVLLEFKNDFCNQKLAYAVMHSTKSIKVLPPLEFEAANSLNFLLPTIGDWRLIDGFESFPLPKVYVIERNQRVKAGSADLDINQGTNSESGEKAEYITSGASAKVVTEAANHPRKGLPRDGGDCESALHIVDIADDSADVTMPPPLELIPFERPKGKLGRYLSKLEDEALFAEVERLTLFKNGKWKYKFNALRYARQIVRENPMMSLQAIAERIHGEKNGVPSESVIIKVISGADPYFEKDVTFPEYWPKQ